MVANAAPNAPGPVSPTEHFRFASKDGLELYGELHAAEEPRAAALILHGYAEHCGRYREVGHVLKRAGISSLAYDMRGHGRAGGPRGHALRFEDFIGDFDAALARLDQSVSPELPLLLVCHSHGSLVALRLLADPWRLPERLRGAVLSSPFLAVKMQVPRVKRAAAQVLGRVLPGLSLPNEIQIEHLTRDPDRLAERRVDTLCHDVAGARWFVEVQKTQAWVTEFAPRIAVPTLWLIAGDDRVVDAEATRAVYDRIPAGAEWHDFEGCYHEVFNELERARAFALIEDFADRVLAHAPD